VTYLVYKSLYVGVYCILLFKLLLSGLKLLSPIWHKCQQCILKYILIAHNPSYMHTMPTITFTENKMINPSYKYLSYPNNRDWTWKSSIKFMCQTVNPKTI